MRYSIALVVLAFVLLPHSANAFLASTDATDHPLGMPLDLSGSSGQFEQADSRQSAQILLPIVSGEPPLEGVVDMPPYGILRIDKGMNSRNLPTTSGSIATPRSAGTLIEINEGEEQLPDSSGGANIWTGGHVIYENGAVIPAADREHVYVALIGNTSTVTDPDSLPVEVKDLYRTPAELPQPESRIDTTDFAQRFQSAADSYGMGDQVASVWSTDDQTNGVGADRSALHAWQQAVAIAAIAHSAITESIPVTVGRPVEIAASFPDLAEGDPYIVYVDPVENGYDVVSRIDLKEKYGDDIYVITRFQNSPGGLRVVATGFASSEGLVAAKGEKAHNIAQISVLNGPGAIELAEAIDDLPQVSVFLPGLENTGIFAPKVEAAHAVHYFRGGGTNDKLYFAGTGYGDETRTSHLFNPAGSWIDRISLANYLRKPQAKAVISEYAQLYQKNVTSLTEALNQPDALKSIAGKHGEVQIFLVDNEVEQPLFVLEDDDWAPVTIGKVASLKGVVVRLAGNLGLTQQYREQLSQMNGYALPDGHWRDPNSTQPLRPSAESYDFSAYDRRLNDMIAMGIQNIEYLDC